MMIQYHLNFQAMLCNPEMNKVKPNTSMCIDKCNGMIVTSFHKEFVEEVDTGIHPKRVSQYQKFMKKFNAQTSVEIKGTTKMVKRVKVMVK